MSKWRNPTRTGFESLTDEALQDLIVALFEEVAKRDVCSIEQVVDAFIASYLTERTAA